MNPRIIGGLVYDLDDAPVGDCYGRDHDGKRTQQLALGSDRINEKLSISLTTTSPERIDELIEALHRIRDDKIAHAQIKQLPEVA